MSESNTNQDELIRRYGAGERDPAILDALNGLAWSQFHDPWEEGGAPSDPRTEEEVMDPSEDPQRAYPLSLERLKTHLKRRGLGYSEEDTAVLVRFAYKHKCDREVTLRISLEGEQEDVLRVHMEADRRVNREDFPHALELCNRFNHDFRWPKAYLEVPESEGDVSAPSGKLMTSHQIDCEEGIHDALLDDFISCAVGASWIFWEEAMKEGL